MKFNEEVLRMRETMSAENERQIIARMIRFASPETDADSVAESMLENLGGLKQVLEARPEQVASIPGVTPKVAELFAMIMPLFCQWQSAQNPDQRIGNRKEAESFCKGILTGLRNEEFWVVCVDAQCRVIGKRCIAQGSLSEVDAYPRKIVETALNYNAHAVFLAHNHPGGTCAPSAQDITSTLRIQTLLKGMDIMVFDHIIVAGDQTYSMIEHGDISYR